MFLYPSMIQEILDSGQKYKELKITIDEYKRVLWESATKIVALEEKDLRIFLQKAEAELDSIQFTTNDFDAALEIVNRIEKKLSAMETIGIVGGGAWGTALGQALASAGRAILLYAREPEIVDAVNARHENPDRLPGIPLSPRLRATGAAEDLGGCGLVLIVTPAQSVRAALSALAPHFAAGTPVILCAKGVELESGKLLTEVAAEILPDSCPVGLLTGPSFAREVALGLPCALVLAMKDAASCASAAARLGTRTLRLYTSDDTTGAAIGGAVKNVIAIACGIAGGLSLGENARAALVTRGLAEMTRLAVALGGRRETLTGLSGMGDLILTATSATSRNYAYGLALGGGERARPDAAVTVEGVPTARALQALSARAGVDMPVCSAVCAVLYEGLEVRAAVESLLDRPAGGGEG